MVVGELGDGEAPGVPAEQQILDIGEDLLFLEGEMFLQLHLVFIEKAPDDLFLLFGELLDQGSDGSLQPDQFGGQVDLVGLADVLDDIEDAATGQGFGFRRIILESIDIANQAGRVRIQALAFGRLADRPFSETQRDPQPVEDVDQVRIPIQHVCQLGLRGENGILCNHTIQNYTFIVNFVSS